MQSSDEIPRFGMETAIPSRGGLPFWQWREKLGWPVVLSNWQIRAAACFSATSGAQPQALPISGFM